MKIEKYNLGSLLNEEYLLFYKSICKNPYILEKPYPKQSWAIFLTNKADNRREDGKKIHNHVLVGAGGFGGKTYLGSMLAAQYLTEHNYSCLVTRKNYSELIGINSIFENLIKWTCNDKLGNLKCTKNEGKFIRIKSPYGAEIHFKAFDREDKKQKIKSESYDRIINDEASELNPKILSFQHRSLRQSIDSQIPLSIVNLSNPGGPSTEYLIKNFIKPDSDYPYIALDWRDNPYINKEDYEASLDELDYLDLQYQKYGNWYYKPKQGDLINRDEIINSFIDQPDYKVSYSVIGIDLAGKGMDSTAISNYQLFENGLEYINDLDQTKNAYPEKMVYDFLDKHNPNNTLVTDLILIEKEPGGDSEYSLRYWMNELEDFIKMGVRIKLVNVHLSKYQRARPLARGIKKLNIRINKKNQYLDDLIDELINLTPEKKNNNNGSPNLVDSLTLSKNFIDKEIKNRKKTRFSVKKLR